MDSPSKIDSSVPMNKFNQGTYNSKSSPHPGTKIEARILHKFKEIFKGEKGEYFPAFLRRFEAYCEAQGLEENEKADNFSCVLDGEAFELYTSFPTKTKACFTATKKEMMTIYGPIRRQQGEKYTGLFSMKMGKNESVKDYYFKIARRLQQSEDYPAGLCLEVFISGLPKYIKDYLKLEKPKNLMEALELARSKESEEISKDDTGAQIQEMKNELENLLISLGQSEE